nr:carbohydrate binding domain-containing protein [Bacillus inaquosorum]
MNLIKNGDFSDELNNWRNWQNVDGNLRRLTTINDFNGEDVNFTKGFFYSTIQTGQYGYAQDNITLLPGKNYTLSVWVRVTKGNGKFMLQEGNSTDGWTATYYDTEPIKLKWTKVTHTFTAKSATTNIYVGQGNDAVNNGYHNADVTGISLKANVENAVATWTPYGISTVKNTGLAPVPPLVRCIFEETATEYKIQLLNPDFTVNKTVKLVFNFIAGDTLLIDFEKRKATLNGNLIMTALQLQSDFFILPSGDSFLKASHPSTVLFKERYL